MKATTLLLQGCNGTVLRTYAAIAFMQWPAQDMQRMVHQLVREPLRAQRLSLKHSAMVVDAFLPVGVWRLRMIIK